MKQTTVGDVVNAHRQEIESLRQQLAEKDAEIERLKKEQVELIRRFHNESCGQTFMGEPVIQDRPVPAKQYMAAVNGRRAFRSQVIELRQQLAASQLREQQLREALKAAAGKFHDYAEYHSMKERTRDNIEKIERNMALARICDEALDQPTDTSALEAVVQQAGEVMRERCLSEIDPKYYTHGLLKEVVEGCCGDLRALPGVTLEDLQK